MESDVGHDVNRVAGDARKRSKRQRE